MKAKIEPETLWDKLSIKLSDNQRHDGWRAFFFDKYQQVSK